VRIGVPREIKDHEYRVGLVPSSVADLVALGHRVMIEKGAGSGAGIDDTEYEAAGAALVVTAEEVWAQSDLVVKVKEPLAVECAKLKPGQILFTYLHLAADRQQTDDLLRSGATCIAYETVRGREGTLPILTPMSEVAGRLAPQAGARCLEKQSGGRGVLLGGVPGVRPAKVVVLGGGVSGTHATTIAIGMRADVTVIDRSPDALRRIDTQFGGSVKTAFATSSSVWEAVVDADLVLGCVLVPGALTPKLVTREMVNSMKPGAAIVDVAIDQGGCCETSRPTTHSKPTYEVNGVIHYCVTNMPAAVARSSTYALNNITLPFTIAIANKGWKRALEDDSCLSAGLNIHAGKVTCEPVAVAHGLAYTPLEQALAA
jgi:alanine dehydrogenase